ncbi:uncharacterized protein C1orf159 homolog isoform X2 [Amia ocellicauda]|uniref:uncharacterized protein C1orf159 homolog isoform X2 n=1 Tax=Amia ocellicauda TaxID=2972642 RepID=UPI003464914C
MAGCSTTSTTITIITIIIAGAALQVVRQTSQSPVSLPDHLQCCLDAQEENGTCQNSTQCDPGCFLQTFKTSAAFCVRCRTDYLLLYNLTDCNHNYLNATVQSANTSTVAPVQPKIGGPGVAASLLLGTLFISLFLILSVASFFYLKRSNKLPNVFYRRNKASIFQPSETAVMIPTPSSSVRKPRYVRRERPVTAATVSTAAVTHISNV